MTSFESERSAVDAALGAIVERYVDASVHPDTARVIRYTLAGEGKRLRGILLLSAYEAAGGRGDASGLAAAVEVVHAYSLVHDDLPCMDDDDMRRGRPTAHRAFGVRAATAAGVAMVPLAVRAAGDAAASLQLPPETRGAIVRELMQASGAGGMIGGQLLDLTAEGRTLSVAELERIHRGKTGALIVAAVRLGGWAARAAAAQLTALERYGAAIGLAFQIADDVLDVTGTSDQLGKTAGRDQALGKSTYPALLGVEGAIHRAGALTDEACEALREVGLLTPALERIAGFVVARKS
ncbi:MAG TPA: farnesyl diphosphate synthase [Gemmatimonadaceae bacterium]|nr:farnesyl diphosphate synthase [Gemmatimonadaceae bacterium]